MLCYNTEKHGLLNWHFEILLCLQKVIKIVKKNHTYPVSLINIPQNVNKLYNHSISISNRKLIVVQYQWRDLSLLVFLPIFTDDSINIWRCVALIIMSEVTSRWWQFLHLFLSGINLTLLKNISIFWTFRCVLCVIRKYTTKVAYPSHCLLPGILWYKALLLGC